MRLISTLSQLPEAQTLSNYLKNQGIANELEISKNTNWDDPQYGDVTCKVWIYDEDLLAKSLEIVHAFRANPQDPKFQSTSSPVIESPSRTSSKATTIRPLRPRAPISEPLGRVTLFLLLCCVFLFFFSSTETLTSASDQEVMDQSFLFSPLKRHLLYDYPQAFEILDHLIQGFGLEALQKDKNLPQAASLMIDEFNHTPYWKGVYNVITTHLQDPATPWSLGAPLFEKIRQGEAWRLFSPALLHADIFHLLFNMIWLIVLGKQLEQRMGPMRYVLFIAMAGIVTNTAQYLMGGFSFVGFSGILCAMLAFVWMRQRQAAWEGYFLQPSTVAFMMAFLGLMLFFQTISFAVEIVYKTSIAPPIANTAHMSGLLFGLLLGCMDFFAWKNP
jgi:GlpG protein